MPGLFGSLVAIRGKQLQGQQVGQERQRRLEDEIHDRNLRDEEQRLRTRRLEQEIEQASKPQPRAIDPLSPEGLAADLTRERQRAEIAARYAKTQQPVAPKPEALTDAQKKASGYYEMARGAGAEIDRLGTPTLLNEMKSKIPFVGNWAKTPQGQVLDRANRQWATNVLRNESGATIGEHEIQQAYDTYLPRPGDSEEVLIQKARARREKERTIGAYGGVAPVSPAAASADASLIAKYGLTPRGR